MNWRIACWKFPPPVSSAAPPWMAAARARMGSSVPARELVNRGYTRAEELLQNYRGVWGRDMTHLFREYNFLLREKFSR